jgi:TetR/AcrR family transcriptional repressor of nem operon
MTKGEETRRRIVAAAAPIFNRNGYEGSTLADLMAATGLKKGGIYRHFSSKEELAAEAFDYTWQAAREARMLNVQEKSSGLEQIKQYIANFCGSKAGVPGGCPILNTAVDADDGNSLLRARVSKALRQWIARLEGMVTDATKKGELRDGVDPRAVGTVIVASLEGALMISRLERNPGALCIVQQHLSEYLDSLAATGQPG